MIPMYDEGGDVKRHSSSPATPGVSGAIGDALASLRDYLMGTPSRQNAVDRQAAIEHAGGLDDTPAQPVQGHADGGEVDYVGNALDRMGVDRSSVPPEGPPDQDSSLVGIKNFLQQHLGELSARAGTSFARQFYGLDKNGHLAFGGRGWTEGQGGTPMGLLDNVTAIPHHLTSLYNLANHLAASATGLPTENAVMDVPSPKFSDDAASRADALKDRADSALGFPKAHTLMQHVADNADVVSPIPGLPEEGALSHLAGLVGGSPLRKLPRTTAEFAGANGILDKLLDEPEPVQHHDSVDPEFERMALEHTNATAHAEGGQPETESTDLDQLFHTMRGQSYGGGGEVSMAERLMELLRRLTTSSAVPTDEADFVAKRAAANREASNDDPLHELLQSEWNPPPPAPVAPSPMNPGFMTKPQAEAGGGPISRRSLLKALGVLGASSAVGLEQLSDRLGSRIGESPAVPAAKTETPMTTYTGKRYLYVSTDAPGDDISRYITGTGGSGPDFVKILKTEPLGQNPGGGYGHRVLVEAPQEWLEGHARSLIEQGPIHPEDPAWAIHPADVGHGQHPVHTALQKVKDEFLGHSDEPNWNFLDKYIPTIPGHEKVLPHYNAVKEGFTGPLSIGEDTDEDYLDRLTNRFHQSLDDLSAEHGVPIARDPNTGVE